MTPAFKAEWIKLTSIRSHSLSLVLYIVLVIGLSVVYGAAAAANRVDRADFDPIGVGLTMAPLGVIVLVAVGVLSVTTEYSTGTIRSSLVAVPRRDVFYGAKVGTMAVASAAVSAVGLLVAFAAVQLLLGERAAGFGLGTVGHLLGAVAYTVLLVLFSMGLAAVLRSSAATLCLLIPLFFMVSTMLSNIPGVAVVAQFLPDIAGGLVLQSRPGDGVLNAWTGLGVLALWTVAAVLVGRFAVQRRDA